jgi:AraC-like DNA-binding protein
MAADTPGAEEVVRRLADALLTQALRVAFARLQPTDAHATLAHGDRQIGAAIRLVVAEPERAWTVGELASRVGLSRSTFSPGSAAWLGNRRCAMRPAPDLRTQPGCSRPPTLR